MVLVTALLFLVFPPEQDTAKLKQWQVAKCEFMCETEKVTKDIRLQKFHNICSIPLEVVLFHKFSFPHFNC